MRLELLTRAPRMPYPRRPRDPETSSCRVALAAPSALRLRRFPVAKLTPRSGSTPSANSVRVTEATRPALWKPPAALVCTASWPLACASGPRAEAEATARVDERPGSSPRKSPLRTPTPTDMRRGTRHTNAKRTNGSSRRCRHRRRLDIHVGWRSLPEEAHSMDPARRLEASRDDATTRCSSVHRTLSHRPHPQGGGTQWARARTGHLDRPASRSARRSLRRAARRCCHLLAARATSPPPTHSTPGSAAGSGGR